MFLGKQCPKKSLAGENYSKWTSIDLSSIYPCQVVNQDGAVLSHAETWPLQEIKQPI